MTQVEKVGGLFHLLHASIQLVDLWLEDSFELGPLGLESWSQQAVLDGELLWVEVDIFHLHQVGRKIQMVKKEFVCSTEIKNKQTAKTEGVKRTGGGFGFVSG